ncbi:GNAT family N-acetyltransferase [Parasediminibacterium sp. JCM 36343]|uniref:GNAT family N-acetyltransferase n=1 Tax=Parasediminibacterium sp. JCM 36343 TaxID=3374279 RepID=UPI00397BDAF8
MDPVSSPITIRTAIFSDLPLVQDIAHASWPSAYSKIISKKQIDYMLEMMYSLESLEKQVFEGNQFILAEKDGAAIGFASFMFRENGVYKLSKLYLLPEAKNTGVGKALLKEIIAKVISLGGKELILQVNRQNKAVGFYEKMGFEILYEFDFNIGEGYVMKDYVMSLKL